LTTNAPDQAESWERPLLRRRRITARPARLRIRRRNPCFFFRLRSAVREHASVLEPGAAYLVRAGSGAADASYAQLSNTVRAILDELWANTP